MPHTIKVDEPSSTTEPSRPPLSDRASCPSTSPTPSPRRSSPSTSGSQPPIDLPDARLPYHSGRAPRRGATSGIPAARQDPRRDQQLPAPSPAGDRLVTIEASTPITARCTDHSWSRWPTAWGSSRRQPARWPPWPATDSFKARPRPVTGAIASQRVPVAQAEPVGQRNSYDLRVRGKRIRVRLNGAVGETGGQQKPRPRTKVPGRGSTEPAGRRCPRRAAVPL